jgi:hypothetical protein
MSKQKFTIEHSLSANSENIIWDQISTVDGLSKWVADDVGKNGNVFTFTWGQPWKNNESRQATLLSSKKNKFIRFKWNDDEDKEDYWEIAIERYELTGDYSLLITDFAEKNELDDQKELWLNSLEQLHRSSGL